MSEDDSQNLSIRDYGDQDDWDSRSSMSLEGRHWSDPRKYLWFKPDRPVGGQLGATRLFPLSQDPSAIRGQNTYRTARINRSRDR